MSFMVLRTMRLPGVAARSGSGSRRTPWSAALLGIPSLLAAYLGNWQLERRQWKMRLLEERREQLLAEPIDLFAVDELPPEYSRVTLTGTYDHAKAAFVGPRGRPSSAGVTEQSYLVVTPLTSADGKRTALVNRGWVPLSWRTDPEERRVGEPSGQVTVVGVVRHGERAGQFVPPNDLEACTWYYVNTAELAQAAGRDADTPLVEAILAADAPTVVKPPSAMEVLGGRARSLPAVPDVVPLPKTLDELCSFSVMPRDHTNYAATWLTLSAATAALAVKAVRGTMRRA